MELTELQKQVDNYLCDRFISDHRFIPDNECADEANHVIKLTLQWVVAWIQSHKLIAPDPDSLTQFVPYYMIELPDVEQLREMSK